jgi:hypothetical protein
MFPDEYGSLKYVNDYGEEESISELNVSTDLPKIIKAYNGENYVDPHDSEASPAKSSKLNLNILSFPWKVLRGSKSGKKKKFVKKGAVKKEKAPNKPELKSAFYADKLKAYSKSPERRNSRAQREEDEEPLGNLQYFNAIVKGGGKQA